MYDENYFKSNAINKFPNTPESFKVGEDISEGEYYLHGIDEVYYKVSNGNGERIFSDYVDYDVYIEVKNGEILEFNNGFLLKSEDVPKLDFDGSLDKGMYKVGRDIPAGEYYLDCNRAYYAVLNDSRHSIDFNGAVDYNVYISVLDGQYLLFSRGKVIRACDVPKLDFDGSLDKGMYKVGKDIPPGKYQFKYGDSLYYCIYENSNQKKIIQNGFVDNKYCIELKKGEYLEFSKGKLIKVDEIEKAKFNTVLIEGEYDVGKDILPGEYYLKARRNAQVYLSSNVGDVILDECNCLSQYVKLIDGDYFKFYNSSLYKLENKLKIPFKGSLIKEGMFKIGFDLPEGEYIIQNNNHENIFIELYNNLRDDGKRLDTNNNRVYVKLNDGDYIKIKNAELKSFDNTLNVILNDESNYDGEYKVGVDLKQDKYFIEPTGSEGYYLIFRILNDGSRRNIDEVYFKTRKEINLFNGQYLLLKNAKVIHYDGKLKINDRYDNCNVDYNNQINDLKNEYEIKDKEVRQLLKKRFNPTEITYNKFLAPIIKSQKMFDKQLERICYLDDEFEIKEQINILKLFIRKLELFADELIISINQSNKKEVDDVLDEMDKLINSVKKYN